MMKEYGLRILIRKCQLVAAQHSRALLPLICYAGRHYFKCCFRCVKSKTLADKVLSKHSFIKDIGPLWTGELCSLSLLQSLDYSLVSSETEDFMQSLLEESEIGTFGFYDIHALSSELKLRETPSYKSVAKRIKEKGSICKTHFSENGFKTTLSEKEVLNVFRAFD